MMFVLQGHLLIQDYEKIKKEILQNKFIFTEE
jgi:hypothetical protein